MSKTTLKTETKDRKTGEKKTHKAISKSLDVKNHQVQALTTDEIINEEDAQEAEAAEQVADILDGIRIQDQSDEMTKFIRARYKLPGLNPTYRYVDSRFPKEESGKIMSVSRVYHSIQLCVDNLPGSWTQEMILAKKWGVEQAGFKYVWKQEEEVVKVIGKQMLLVLETVTNSKNEEIEKTEDFWNRIRPVKAKPAFTFDMRPFSFTMNRGMGMAHA